MPLHYICNLVAHKMYNHKWPDYFISVKLEPAFAPQEN